MNRDSRLSQDQAMALRQLVRAARAAAGQPVDAPIGDEGPGAGRMVVVAGAKGGVGATSIALLLAKALSAEGAATLVVDANLRQADLAHVAQASTEGRYDLADVLSGVCTTADARIPLIGSLSLLPGAWAPAAQPDANVEAVQRWLDDLSAMVARGENVVLDVGVGMRPWTEPLWRRATQITLVTTPDKLSVLDAYAAAKLARGEGVTTEIGLLVNRAPNLPAAQAVHHRVDETCQRFMGDPMPMVGWAPEDRRLWEDPLAPPDRHSQMWARQLPAGGGSATRAA